MENRDEQKTFNYTYSAKQQEEIKSIRKKYMAPQEDKMDQLRRLDQGVTKKASAAALIAGILGALILGFGMSLVMTDLGEIFGSYRDMSIVVGIISGICGIALICCAYPIYNRVLKTERERIAPEIIRLTDELIK